MNRVSSDSLLLQEIISSTLQQEVAKAKLYLHSQIATGNVVTGKTLWSDEYWKIKGNG